MIKIHSLEKFYNKGKNNEIHVVNNCSLEFPNTGLVCLLGPSGSGKTTLLNLMGGLDKLNKGKIEIKENSIEKYNARKWDKIRAKHFGYIFQNYNLLPKVNVYDNVAISLKMTNIDESLIEERVMYALSAVKMERYKKKRVDRLSGGQQQRVSIARALVKSPNVIFADEPSGNLDEKNTTQIMNIIKKISSKCLVVLVTHEERIAEFYADRIIRMKDGIIVSDEENYASQTLELKDDQNIYLKDMKQRETNDENVNIKYFFDDEEKKLELKIVYKNNTFYIESNQKVKLLNKSNEIRLVDAHRSVMDEKAVQDFDYQLDSFDITNKSLIKNKDCIKMAFGKAINSSKKRKVVLLGFVFIAFLITISFSLMYGALTPKEEYYVTDSKKIVTISNENYPSYEELKEALGTKGISYYLYNDDLSFNLDYIPFNQLEGYDIGIDIKPLSISELSTNDLIYGVLPTNKTQIVLDKTIIDSKKDDFLDFNFKYYGINSSKNFLGKSLIVHEQGENIFKAEIVGISDTGTPNTYIDLDYYYEIILAQKGFGVEETLNSGEVDLNNPLRINSFNTDNETDYIYIDSIADKDVFLTYISDEDARDFFLKIAVNDEKIKIISADKNETIDFLDSIDSKGIDDYLFSKTVYMLGYTTIYGVFLTIATILLSIGMVFLYFMIRTGMISRVYEIGVYRSLGVRKKDIYKIFFWEIMFIGFLTSMVGFAFGLYFAKGAEAFDFEAFPARMPLIIALATIGFLFLINVFIGLLPLVMLLRKTPSEISAKYDI